MVKLDVVSKLVDLTKFAYMELGSSSAHAYIGLYFHLLENKYTFFLSALSLIDLSILNCLLQFVIRDLYLLDIALYLTSI